MPIQIRIKNTISNVLQTILNCFFSDFIAIVSGTAVALTVNITTIRNHRTICHQIQIVPIIIIISIINNIIPINQQKNRIPSIIAWALKTVDLVQIMANVSNFFFSFQIFLLSNKKSADECDIYNKKKAAYHLNRLKSLREGLS